MRTAFRYMYSAVLCIVALLGASVFARVDVQDKPLEPKVAAEALKRQKKELLRRMEELESKLPPELARKLMILSMRIASGYCSPYPVRDFEDDLAAVDPSVAKSFEAEWKRVKEHPLWPSTAEIRKQSPPKTIS